MAIFKVKSALESHLQTKHPDKQPISVDQIPDVKLNDDQHYQTDGAWSHIDTKFMINPSSYEMNCVDNQSVGLNRPDDAPLHQMQNTHPDADSMHFSQLNWMPNIIQSHDHFDTGESDEISYSADDSNTDQEDMFEKNCTDNSIVFGRKSSMSNEKIGDWNDRYVEYTESFRNERKRRRTTLNPKQLTSLRTLFGACKTPNMIECELVGREIGLPKRVIQVGCLPIVNLFCCGEKVTVFLVIF